MVGPQIDGMVWMEVAVVMHSARSHIGLVRPMNQDSYAVLEDLPQKRLYLIADGMGGPSAGEVASQIAVETVQEIIRKEDLSHPEVSLRRAIYVANQKIFQASRANADYLGMGTTVVGALVDDDSVSVAHVGDSRAYLWHGGSLQQVTEDHSLVAELVRRGQLTEDEASHHPQRHIVTRSLGAEEHHYPDVQTFRWVLGDVLLLCSDGLSNLVSPSELASYVEAVSAAPSQSALDRVTSTLVQLALDRGGSDNITLILICHGPGGEVE